MNCILFNSGASRSATESSREDSVGRRTEILGSDPISASQHIWVPGYLDRIPHPEQFWTECKRFARWVSGFPFYQTNGPKNRTLWKMPIETIATISPTAGKEDRVEQLLREVIDHVTANEKDVLKYQLLRQVDVGRKGEGGLVEFVMLETYANLQAAKAHGDSEVLKRVMEMLQVEELLRKPLNVMIVKAVAGFAER
ncbi:hypothetical protein K402DRAFT_66262 [Aulographum hederae CBS 113979]|uniref:ABM domain-containing protein n=1 Tax=Aulographum hederae CBS 113979 TaxID=1176131 RepID=A0A6G1H0R6_9PEZI|nr:hypothetical protein K402DRAFT_66262 [Aulographum hederae CBS 113979]